MTTATPDVVTRLDERTEAELQPPCEITSGYPGGEHQHCDNPADWILRARCIAHCESAITLVCHPHLIVMRHLATHVVCRMGHPVYEMTWEKL
jgi:hypothetical protein